MRYSVIICTHNRGPVLGRALAAVLGMESPADGGWEVVVVDNRSTDGTADLVRKVAAEAPVPVRSVYEDRLGHSRALNAGVRAARGEVLAFTDDDALPAPRWLATIGEAMAEYRADWVFGPIDPVWPAGEPDWFHEVLRPYFAVLDYGPKPFVVESDDRPFYGVNHACRRAALGRLGGYAEHLGGIGAVGGIGNDEDLFRRGRRAGLKFVYHPEVRVGHLIAPRRCDRGFHRRSMWRNTGPYYRYLLADPPRVAWFAGLPRFLYRRLGWHLGQYLRGWLTGPPGVRFYHELMCIRFGGLAWRALTEYRHGRLWERAGRRPARLFPPLPGGERGGGQSNGPTV